MSLCCFASPITSLGSGQYWVNITVIEEIVRDNSSFSVLFGGLYHFPLPIVIRKDGSPAACRLDNPGDTGSGSIWTCMETDARFRIDTNPSGSDPIILKLSTPTSGDCHDQSFCSSGTYDTAHTPSADIALPNDSKISLGALGTYEKGAVITAFTLGSLLIVGLIGIYFYRNRKPKDHVEPSTTDSNDPSQVKPIDKIATKLKTDRDAKATMIKQMALKGKNSIPSKARDKSLLKMIQEKSEKPKSPGLLIRGSDTLINSDKNLIQNEFGDDRSDYSNVPLANLYKK